MKKTLSKVAVVAVALLLLSSVLAMGAGEPEVDPDRVTVGLTLPSLGHPFFIHLQNNVMMEADELDVEVLALDANNETARQMSIVEDFIARGVDAVLMSPIGADALVPAVEELNAVDIPVATVDRAVADGDVLVHLGADNIEGGRVAGEYLIEALDGSGRVLELEGTPGATPAIERADGFHEVIEDTDIEVLASVTAEFDRAQGQSVMEDLIEAHGEFDGVFAANDEMALGAIEAIEAAGIDLDDVVIVGYDAIPDALSYMEEGRLDATVEQFPGEQARVALNYLYEYVQDGVAPPGNEHYIAPVIITPDNIDEAEDKVE